MPSVLAADGQSAARKSDAKGAIQRGGALYHHICTRNEAHLHQAENVLGGVFDLD